MVAEWRDARWPTSRPCHVRSPWVKARNGTTSIKKKGHVVKKKKLGASSTSQCSWNQFASNGVTKTGTWKLSVFLTVNPLHHEFATIEASIDYRCEDRKTVDKLRGDIGAIRYVLTPSFRKPWSSFKKKKKTNRSARRCIWRYRFQAGVWNYQLLNQVLESQLFTSLWNRYHQWLPDIELIQTSAFCNFLSVDKPRFHCWKANPVLKLSRNLQILEIYDLHIYSLWSQVVYLNDFLYLLCLKPCMAYWLWFVIPFSFTVQRSLELLPFFFWSSTCFFFFGVEIVRRLVCWSTVWFPWHLKWAYGELETRLRAWRVMID